MLKPFCGLAGMALLQACANQPAPMPLYGQFDGVTTCFSPRPGWQNTISLRLRPSEHSHSRSEGEALFHLVNPKTGEEGYAAVAVTATRYADGHVDLQSQRLLRGQSGLSLEKGEWTAQMVLDFNDDESVKIKTTVCGSPVVLVPAK